MSRDPAVGVPWVEGGKSERSRTVLLIGNYPPPFGGVPKHLAELVPTLVAAGWTTHIFSPGRGDDLSGPGFVVHRDRRGPVHRRVGFLPLPLWAGRPGVAARVRTFRRMMPARTWLRALSLFAVADHIGRRHPPDLVAAYNLLFGAPVAAMVASVYEVPLIVTNFGEIYSHEPQARAHRRFIEHLTRTATLTTLSRHCAESYHALDLSPPVEVLPYGVDTRRFAERGTALLVRRELGFEAEDRIALFVGRLIPDMGLDTVLRATPGILGSVERARIVVAGADGALRTHAAEVAAASDGRVRLVVDVPEADLPRYLWAADVLMAPTQGRRACGSLAALEAMAAGRPVVAANVGGIPEIVADHDTGILVPPGNPAALATAVASLLADPARASEMGRRGVARVRALFDIRTTNAAIEHLFRRVTARRSSPDSPGARH